MKTSQLKPTIAHGLQAMRRDDYRAAIDQFSIFLDQIDPQTEKAHYHQARLQALHHLGTLEDRMGRRDDALRHFEQYVAEARDAAEQAFGMAHLGMHLIRLSRLEEGMTQLRRAGRLAQEANYSAGRAHAFMGMAVGFLHYGRHDEALTQAETALALFEQLGDEPQTARAYNIRGIIHAQQGALDKAITSFRAAEQHAQQLGNYDAAIILGNLGEAYQTLYDLEKALATHQKALELAATTQIPTISIDLRRNIGVTLCRLGHADEGITYLQRSLNEARQYKQTFLLGQIIYSLALAEHMRGDHVRAAKYATELWADAEKRGQRSREAQALHALGLCAQAAGDTVKAEQQWHQALFLAHETGQQTLLWQIHAALAKISDNPGLAATHWRIAWEVIEQIIYPLSDDTLRETFLNAPPVREIRAQQAE